jgi:gelsolin
LLGDLPVQYREVNGNESQRFLKLWNKIRILDGGIDSGFNKVKPHEYKPKLLHVTGHKKHVEIFQVPFCVESLCSHDSFILDQGLTLYLFHGDKASNWEKRTASFEVNDIKAARHGKVDEVHIIDGIDEKNEEADAFWELLGGKPESLPEEVKKGYETVTVLRMLKVSDESGSMTVTTVTDGHVDIEKLESGDVFICDFGLTLYIWVGSGANKAEKKKAMLYAVQYLQDQKRSTKIPVCRVVEGREPDHFMKLMKEGKTHGWDAEMMTCGFIGRRHSVVVTRDV